MGGKKSAAAAWKRDLILVVPSPLAIVFTKMPFYDSELQNCHFWASNVGPFTQMTWK